MFLKFGDCKLYLSKILDFLFITFNISEQTYLFLVYCFFIFSRYILMKQILYIV